MKRKNYLYQHHTWPELGQVAKRQPVVVLPIGSVEDHGPHLPLDVDNFLIWNICEAAAQRADGDILLMPIIPFGYETHHMDFPGTIDIQIQHLLEFVLDVTKSVAHHGFRRILIADGHGSNMPILDLVARRTILETEALCAPFLWPSLALKEIRQLRESGRGGMSHACELETSVYLYLDAERVQMDKARKETAQPQSDFIWNDLTDPGPIRMMDYWTCFSKSGINGDPTLATAEKGRIIFEEVVSNFVRFAREFKSRVRGERVDYHRVEWQS
jgi:creatinine amidohydrolase